MRTAPKLHGLVARGRAPRTRPRLLAAPDVGADGAGPTRAPRAAGGPPPALGEVILLIVDDDPLMTEFLPRRLARAMVENVRILTAANAAEADAVLARESPHVVVSDFNLRETKTGVDVLREVARLAPSSARILFSGHTRREIGGSLEAAGIHAYVEKPMKLDELIVTLLEAIRTASGMDLARERTSDARG